MCPNSTIFTSATCNGTQDQMIKSYDNQPCTFAVYTVVHGDTVGNETILHVQSGIKYDAYYEGIQEPHAHVCMHTHRVNPKFCQCRI